MVQLKYTFSSSIILNGARFQFLYGTIKIILTNDDDFDKQCFNSSMVQLKFFMWAPMNSIFKFQFLYGTIKMGRQ